MNFDYNLVSASELQLFAFHHLQIFGREKSPFINTSFAASVLSVFKFESFFQSGWSGLVLITNTSLILCRQECLYPGIYTNYGYCFAIQCRISDQRRTQDGQIKNLEED
jgi:hypothetical protein